MTRFPRVLASVLLLVGLLVVTASPVAAATAKRTWQATIGTSRVLGSATVTLYPTYTGAVRVSLVGLTPNTTYQVMIYKGLCRTPTALAKLSGVRTDGSGDGSRTSSLSFRSGVAVWTAASRGSIGIRVATGEIGRAHV